MEKNEENPELNIDIQFDEQINVEPHVNGTSINHIYQENSTNWRYFLEWRHRIMIRAFIGLGALFLIIKWLYEAQLYSYIYIPFLLASILFYVVYLLDKRNAEVISISRQTGANLEKQLNSYNLGFYSSYPENKGKVARSYTSILKILYLVASNGFLLSSIFMFIKFSGWTIFKI